LSQKTSVWDTVSTTHVCNDLSRMTDFVLVDNTATSNTSF
jgi:hypothetical protein